MPSNSPDNKPLAPEEYPEDIAAAAKALFDKRRPAGRVVSDEPSDVVEALRSEPSQRSAIRALIRLREINREVRLLIVINGKSEQLRVRPGDNLEDVMSKLNNLREIERQASRRLPKIQD